MSYPDMKQCMKMLDRYGTPEHVIGHCKAVAFTACAIGAELKKHGSDLNIPLILAAGLLHDMARTSQDHEKVAADHLSGLGLDDIADIVRVHMRYPKFNELPDINETDLVCLGDRLCIFDQYAGVDPRMDYIIRKCNNDPRAEKVINENRLQIHHLLDDIEGVIGISVDDLCGSYGLREHAQFMPNEPPDWLRDSL